MRLIMDGNTQNLYTLIVAADSRWPHVNCDRLQLWFPEQAIEAGNAAASCKIGASSINGANNTGVDDVMTEGDRKFYPASGQSLNGNSLRNKWVRGSVASTILMAEPTIG